MTVLSLTWESPYLGKKSLYWNGPRSMFSMKKDYQHMHHLSVMKWDKILIYFTFSKNISACKGLILWWNYLCALDLILGYEARLSSGNIIATMRQHWYWAFLANVHWTHWRLTVLFADDICKCIFLKHFVFIFIKNSKFVSKNLINDKSAWFFQVMQRFKIIYFLMGHWDPWAMILMGHRAMGMGPIIDVYINWKF